MRRFLVIVQVILVVAGIGLGGFVGYQAWDLRGKSAAPDELPSYLILAVVALVLVAAAHVVRPREDAEADALPAPQRRAPGQPPFQPGGYRPGGPHTGSQPPIGGPGGPGGPHTGSQPPIGGPGGPGGPQTGPQPRLGGPDQPYGDQPFGGRTEQYPRP